MGFKKGNAALLVVGIVIILGIVLGIAFGPDLGSLSLGQLTLRQEGQETQAAPKEQRGKPSQSSAILTVTPNPVPYGTYITINGSGFKAYETVLINTSHLPSPEVTTDANGAFSYVYSYTYGVGNASVQAYTYQRKGWVLVATASFTVCSTNPCQ